MEQIYEDLIKLFLEENSKTNLSALRNKEDVKIKHILDSLELNKIFKFESGSKIIDLGTGGGFPLVPLAISNPDCNFEGIDARRKKMDAVNNIINNLGLKNAKATWTRGEDHKVKYDYLVTRAVGYIDKLMKFGYHLVKKGGYFILYKMNTPQEAKDIEKICDYYDLEIEATHTYKLFDDDIERLIYVIKKL